MAAGVRRAVVGIFRHNVSKRARPYSRADVFVVSIPKSERTWLRVFLHAYFCALHKREFTLNPKEFFSGRDALSKPVLLLARDPRDVMVSLFF